MNPIISKEQLLEEVKNLAAQNTLSREELLSAFSAGHGVPQPGMATIAEQSEKKSSLAKVLYYIGGLIIFLGLVILAGQNWTSFNFPTKLLITLGAGIIAYIAGVAYSRYQTLDEIGNAFFLVSGLMIPGGLLVLFDHLNLSVQNSGTQALAVAISLIIFFASWLWLKKNIFVVFIFIFSTWLFFALTGMFLPGISANWTGKYVEYRFLITGISYLFIGYYFSQRAYRWLSGALYGFGALFLLGSAIFLGGYSPDQNAFWEIIYPFLIFELIYLSTKFKSKSILVFSALFLMAYILKITSEYFSASLGWPIALVFAGLALIAISYLAVFINKKYLKRAV